MQEIAKDEMKVMAEEKRSERRNQLAPGESMITPVCFIFTFDRKKLA